MVYDQGTDWLGREVRIIGDIEYKQEEIDPRWRESIEEIIRSLRSVAEEFREARRCPHEANTLRFISGKSFSPAVHLLSFRLMPQAVLNAIAQAGKNNPNAGLPEVLIGYLDPEYDFRETSNFVDGNVCIERECTIRLLPGAVSATWWSEFSPICETVDAKDDLDVATELMFRKNRFAIYGYHATACDLLAGWVESELAKSCPPTADMHARSAVDFSKLPTGDAVADECERVDALPKLKNALSSNDRLILVAMATLDAGPHKPETGRVLVRAALYSGDEKRAFKNLAFNGLVDSKRGASGGYWLTTDGKKWADYLVTNGATNSPTDCTN